jgi:hypothetical protein
MRLSTMAATQRPADDLHPRIPFLLVPLFPVSRKAWEGESTPSLPPLTVRHGTNTPRRPHRHRCVDKRANDRSTTTLKELLCLGISFTVETDCSLFSRHWKPTLLHQRAVDASLASLRKGHRTFWSVSDRPRCVRVAAGRRFESSKGVRAVCAASIPTTGSSLLVLI